MLHNHLRKMIRVFVMLSCLLLSYTASECPVCPKNSLPCHFNFTFTGSCSCKTCLTKCSVTNPICEKGKVCTYETVYYGEKLLGDSVVCKPFASCPELKCVEKCPVSGYYADINGCATCLCKEPCQELKCKGECFAPSFYPGEEPKFQCRS